jgi:hypothetical protein
MNRLKFVFILLALPSFLMGQNRLWLSSGANTNVINKKLNVEARFSARFFDNQRWDRFFPEVSASYKVHKYFKPDIDYRYVVSQKRNSNTIVSGHRLNFNLNSGFKVDRLDFKFRVRFQYSFDRFRALENYDPDFDSAIRFRSSIKYNIKGSKVDPRLENEFFYNTNNDKFGHQFTKYRFGIGADIKLPNKHVVTIKYRYDHEFNVSKPRRFHILSLSHDWTHKQPKKKGSTSRI